MNRLHLTCTLLLTALLAFPASAQRAVSFAELSVPTSGSVVITALEGLPESGSFQQIDAATSGALRRIAAAQDFTGKADSQLLLTGFAHFDQLLVLGLGESALTQPMIENIGGKVVQWANGSRAAQVELIWDGASAEAAWLAFGAELGQYRFDKYKTAHDQKAPEEAQTLIIRSADSAAAASLYQSQWQPIARAANFARDLSTEPANVLWPEVFVERVREAIKGLPNLSMEVLDVPAMERLGMGGRWRSSARASPLTAAGFRSRATPTCGR